MGFKRTFRKRKWKVDVWFVRKEIHSQSNFMNYVEKRLNNHTRETILKFKHLREQKNLEITGAEIYEAVLFKKIISEKQFLKFAKSLKH